METAHRCQGRTSGVFVLQADKLSIRNYDKYKYQKDIMWQARVEEKIKSLGKIEGFKTTG